jgi:hypothetical protein
MLPRTLSSLIPAMGLLVGALIVSGCGDDQPRAAHSVPRNQISVGVPSFTIIAGSSELVDKEGVKVTATPKMPAKGSFTYVTAVTEKPTLLIVNGAKNYQIRRTSISGYGNEYLSVDARIQNTSQSVLRLKDASIVVQVDGHLFNLDQAAFTEVQKVVIPPGATVSFSFAGPAWSTFQNNGDIKIGIYDLPIADKKTSFEFDYTIALTPDVLETTDTYQDMSLSPEQSSAYQQRLIRDRQRYEDMKRRSSAQAPTTVQ